MTEQVQSIRDIGIDQIYHYSEPLFKALYPYVLMLFALAFAWWLVAKIIAWQKGEEKPLAILGKSLTMLFIIFMWPQIFIGSYLLNDAWAARIEEIDITTNLPSSIREYITRNELPTNFDSTLKRLETQDFWSNVKPAEDKSFFDKFKENYSLNNWLGLKPMWDDWLGMKGGIEVIIRLFMGFLARIAKTVVMSIRLILSIFYYIAIPFLFVCSLFPVIGEQKSNEGLNNYSKKTISWFLNMAFWPTIFALLDKVFLLIYYLLIAHGLLFDMGVLVAFYCSYIILTITLPISIAQANPYGIVHGTISAMQTMAMVGGMAATGMARAGAGGAKGVAGLAAAGGMISAVKSAPRANVDIAAEGD
ncbi:MAG: hypothetical protein ABIH39_04575 [Candidatus Margulisiibacteriota bacterium]